MERGAGPHCHCCRRRRTLFLSSVHSDASEATYKALTFGPQTRHPWFVSKLPTYSLAFGDDGRSVTVATADNRLYALTATDAAAAAAGGEEDL